MRADTDIPRPAGTSSWHRTGNALAIRAVRISVGKIGNIC